MEPAQEFPRHDRLEAANLDAKLPGRSIRIPVVAVGDTHGSSPELLKEDLIALKVLGPDGRIHPGYEGVLLQIGDTVDRGAHSIEMFSFWRDLQKESPDRVIRLFGNHELFHLIGIPEQIHAQKIPGLQEMLLQDLLSGRLRAAWYEGDTLYTHAGVDLEVFPEFRGQSLDFISEDLNRRLREMAEKISLTDRWNNIMLLAGDPIFSSGPRGDGFGGGILWARQNIENDEFRQVVGHTPQKHGMRAEVGARVKYIDVLRHRKETSPDPEVARQGREIMNNTARFPRPG